MFNTKRKENSMAKYVPGRNSLINHAIGFATTAHGSQVRKGNSHIPYIFHPIDVANEVIYYSDLPKELIEVASVVAILHDTVEDTQVTDQDVRDQFGDRIADGVGLVTKNESVPQPEQLRENLVRLEQAPLEIKAVKMADRVSNLKAFPAMWDRERIGKYLDDSVLISESVGDASEMLNARLLNRVAEMRNILSLSR